MKSLSVKVGVIFVLVIIFYPCNSFAEIEIIYNRFKNMTVVVTKPGTARGTEKQPALVLFGIYDGQTPTRPGEGYSKSIHNILLVIHQIIDDAQIEALITHNPYIKIEKPKREKPEVDFLSTHEIPIFLKAGQTYKEPKQKISKITDKTEKKKERPKCETTMHALFFTDIFSGMRRGELLGLQWGDIDWVNEKIHVRRSLYKGGFQTPKSEYSKRAIDRGPRLIQVLKEHRAKQNEIRLRIGSGWANNDIVFCDYEELFGCG